MLTSDPAPAADPAAATAAASGLKGAARGSRVCEGVRSLRFELTGEKFRPAGPVKPLSGLFIQPGNEEAHDSADEETSRLASKTPPSALSSPQSKVSAAGGWGLSGTDTLASVGDPSELVTLTQGEVTNVGGRSAYERRDVLVVLRLPFSKNNRHLL